jgi:hypothetical protein
MPASMKLSTTATGSPQNASMGNLAGLAVDLRATFPGLRVAAPLRVLGAGFHSLVVETGDG